MLRMHIGVVYFESIEITRARRGWNGGGVTPQRSHTKLNKGVGDIQPWTRQKTALSGRKGLVTALTSPESNTHDCGHIPYPPSRAVGDDCIQNQCDNMQFLQHKFQNISMLGFSQMSFNGHDRFFSDSSNYTVPVNISMKTISAAIF